MKSGVALLSGLNEQAVRSIVRDEMSRMFRQVLDGATSEAYGLTDSIDYPVTNLAEVGSSRVSRRTPDALRCQTATVGDSREG